MKINTFGWVGLIISFLSVFASCKKEDKTPTPTSTATVNVQDGQYIGVDADANTRDTIYLSTSGTNTLMTCPDMNGYGIHETIQYNISGSDITIPPQVIYGSASTIQGSGTVFSNTLTLDWTFSSYSKHKVYIKQ